MMLRIKTKSSKLVALAFIGSLLTACGGGGGGGSDTGGTNPVGGSNPPPAAGTKDISLNWTAPSSRTDGSSVSLSEVGGYKVYVGTQSGNYNPGIDVGNTTSHTLSSMSPGTYYLALSAYDSNSQESQLSSEFPVTIN